MSVATLEVDAVESNAVGPIILIIGASLGGTEAFQLLKSNFRNVRRKPSFVIVERKASYHFHDACPRSLVDPDFASQTVWSYDSYLNTSFMQGYTEFNCKFIQGEVSDLSSDKATLVSGQVIQFDYCVVATGCTESSIFKPNASTREEYLSALNSIQHIISVAKNINLIGGGPSGCELAAEIKSKYPEKRVTIIHSQEKLLAKGSYSDYTKDRLERRLRASGVDLVLGARVNLPDEMYINSEHTLTTSIGQTIASDLTIKCISSPKPNSSFLPSSCRDSQGFITVDQHLMVDGYKNTFAMGDVASTLAPKMTRSLHSQAKIIASNIYALATEGDLRIYYPPKDNLISVTLGKFKAVSEIPVPFDWIYLVIGWIVDLGSGIMKGPSMFGHVQKRKFGLVW